eukprot:15459291-Alexandrium_andersonii.AAC.1
MARGRRQPGGKPCTRPRCRASDLPGGRRVRVASTNPDRDIRCVVRGDDFTFAGLDPDLDWAEKVMTEAFLCKVEG